MPFRINISGVVDCIVLARLVKSSKNDVHPFNHLLPRVSQIEDV